MRRIGSPGELSELLGIGFSPEQLRAITAPLTPNLIVAGAGTGKTTVMAARVVWLVGTGQVRPDAVLGLTFTRRAAAELDAKITRALAVLGDDIADESPLVATYDSFAGQLLDWHGLRLGPQAHGRLITDAEPYQLAAEVVGKPGFVPQLLGERASSTIVERLLDLDQQMTAHLVDEESIRAACEALTTECEQAPGYRGAMYANVRDVSATAAERLELLQFVRCYRELKQERGCVEFADQQAMATRLACSVPAVGAAWRDRFQVVLLDEYQDTSAVQAKMLSQLFGDGFPVSAVGDPRQSIYGWRGAAADNMGQFGHLFAADGQPVVTYPLATNRRSGHQIVAVANAVAGQSPGMAAQQPLVPDEKRPPGTVEARTFLTYPEEAADLASRVAEAHRLGWADSWADEAVLVRRNGDIPAIYQALTDIGVPVEIVGIGGLMALPEIASVIALLRLAADEADNPAVVLLISGPACGLGTGDMAALAHRARELDDRGWLLDAVCDPGSGVSPVAHPRLRRLAGVIQSVRRQRHEAAVDLVRIAADELGLTSELVVPSAWSQAVAPQWRRFVAHVSDQSAVSLNALLAWLDAEAAYGDQLDQATPSADDSVKLLTVHKAKGLEWSVVALPGLCQGIFPNDMVGGNPLTNAESLPYALRLDAGSLPRLGPVSKQSIDDFSQALKDDQMASEDRLGYVAVSRAKTRLLASASYWRAGWARPRPPSRLFRTIAGLASVTELVDEPTLPNPLDVKGVGAAWPVTLDHDEQERLDAAAAAVADGSGWGGDAGLSPEDAGRVARWQALADQMIQQTRRQVAVPASVSASALLTARRDEAAFFDDVARPMPRLVDEHAARGTSFHRWVERRFQSAVSFADWDDDGDEAPDGGGGEIADLVAAFERGRYAHQTPLAVEASFVAVVAGQQVRGRIDAVYPSAGHKYQIVDWKTSSRMDADPMQLSLYRLAWAQSAGCPLEDVDAVFYYVKADKMVRPELASQAQIEAWVATLRQDGGIAAT